MASELGQEWYVAALYLSLLTDCLIVRKPRVRNYELERRKLEATLEECTDGHPLQAIVSNVPMAIDYYHNDNNNVLFI